MMNGFHLSKCMNLKNITPVVRRFNAEKRNL